MNFYKKCSFVRCFLASFTVLVFLSCDSFSGVATCDFSRLDKVTLLDTIVARNLTTLPPIFSDKLDVFYADSIDVKSLPNNNMLVVSQYLPSISELFFFLVEGDCLSLEGYGPYFTRRRNIDKVTFIVEHGAYSAEITGRERISSESPVAFIDTLELNLDGLNE